ncbi:MAG: DUF2306 domain-containing protein [Bacteroidota bacterium]
MKKQLFLGFLWLGALSMIIMSAHYLQAEKTGILRAKAVADLSWYRLLFFLHVGGGLVAISTGPFQFLTRLREQNLRWHRYLGRLYVVAVGLSGLAGLFIAPHAMGGWVAGTGFALLACCWLTTTGLAITSIRTGNIATHRQWMFASYALTFAAIPQRTMLLLAMIPGVSFISVYQVSAWLPWLLNLWIARRLFHWRKRARPQVL